MKRGILVCLLFIYFFCEISAQQQQADSAAARLAGMLFPSSSPFLHTQHSHTKWQ